MCNLGYKQKHLFFLLKLKKIQKNIILERIKSMGHQNSKKSKILASLQLRDFNYLGSSEKYDKILPITGFKASVDKKTAARIKSSPATVRNKHL